MNASENKDERDPLRWIKRGLALVSVLVLAALVGIWVQNRPRVNAYSYLVRDLRKQALLETWTLPPSAVLKSFPATESVIGVRRRGARALDQILGKEIVNARLVGSKVNDLDLEALQRFPEIEYLELVDASVSEAALERFQQALPNCKVVHVASQETSP